MNINKEEMWPECNRILAEIIDTQGLQQAIMEHIASFSHNKKQIWAHVFEDILRNKIFGTPLPTIANYWGLQVIIMESLIPNQFVEKCKEICADLDEETALLFKYYWIESLSFLNTMAQLKS